MPNGNVIRLLNGVTPGGGGSADSAVYRPQVVRDEALSFWIHVSGSVVSGQVQVRGSPDDQAHALTTPNGQILHTVIFTGAPGIDQTRLNLQFQARVVVQAMPIMFVRLTGVSGSETVYVWLME